MKDGRDWKMLYIYNDLLTFAIIRGSKYITHITNYMML
jgi:hypothetical protein